MVTESYSAFLADFGVETIVDSVALRGIFDNGFAEIYGMDGAKPSVMCASSEVSAATRGSTVYVNATSYTVAGIEPDGTGMTKLLLEKV